jgi:hypothetical protein
MILVLKLLNGETVLGLLALEDDTFVTIQDPMVLEYRTDLKGHRSMVLNRYNQFSMETTISFKNTMVVSMYTADDDLSEYYFYTLDHCYKFRDSYASTDIQRASEYLQSLIDNNNKPPEPTTNDVSTVEPKSSNTVH